MRQFLCLSGLFLLSTLACAQDLRPWRDYRTILWMGGQAQKQKNNPKLPERLRELGVNTGMASAGGDPQWLTDAGFGHYVENMVTKGLCLKFRSSVTNWSKFVDDWKMERSEAGLIRDYSLEDPKWRDEALTEMRKLVAHHAPFKPLAYDIRDELSVTVSANPFDYDFSPISLAGFREWLKTEYPSLEALNAQWETGFPTWEAVKPFTTDQIKHRIGTGEAAPAARVDWQAARNAKFDLPHLQREPTRWNFSPWMDHRTYMDRVLAKTLGDLRRAAREIDPETPVGIEGTQMPHAYGGYDLWRLSQVLDWVEPYDVCNSREILGSFMPGKPILATVFEKDSLPAQRRLWHLLLEGDKGCIIWWSEDVIDWSKPDLPLTAKGKALAPVMKQMTSPLAKLFMLAERERDPIAIHYSHPSIQAAWLLESIADGATWLRRFSSYEADHNRHAMLRNAWLKAFQDLGYSPWFVASEQLTEETAKAPQALVLPDSKAMSEAELASLAKIATDPKRIIMATGVAGVFDEHGCPRKNWAPLPGVHELDMTTYAANRLGLDAEHPQLQEVAKLLEVAAIEKAVSVPASARVRVHRFKAGGGSRLIAFERNIEYKMREELAQAGGNEALEKPVTFKAALKEPGHVVNLRTGEKLGWTAEFEVVLDPWLPALFAVLPEDPQGNVVETLLRPLQ